MGRRGPRPKPTIIKIAEGNRGKRKVNTNEPKPPPLPGLPSPPAWLNPLAVEEWNRIGPELIRLGLFSAIDLTQFAAYCEAYADVQEAAAIIADEGRNITTDKGNTIQHPSVGQKNRALLIMRNFASDFGLSPASRPGIGAEGAAKSGGLITRKRG